MQASQRVDEKHLLAGLQEGRHRKLEEVMCDDAHVIQQGSHKQLENGFDVTAGSRCDLQPV